MFLFYTIIAAIIAVCVIGAAASCFEAMYIPRKDDIVVDKDGNRYKVLSSTGLLPDHVTVIEIDPYTKKIKYDAIPVGLRIDEIVIVETAKADKYKVS